MAKKGSHDTTAKRIAKRFRAEYNPRIGPDIPTENMVIEVETENTINDAARQLQGYRKPVYVAPTTQKGLQKALERYKNATIGVMDNKGDIVKKSTRAKLKR